jgi:FXSXX-COOH protein
MDGVTPVDGAEAEPDFELVDLSGIALDELCTVDDAPFAHALRRIIRESDDGDSVVVAGFDSTI